MTCRQVANSLSLVKWGIKTNLSIISAVALHHRCEGSRNQHKAHDANHNKCFSKRA